MSRLCIIPARGGSKRIPRKNIRLFLGEPIIVYSIKAALSSGLFDEVMVSTDDSAIAEVAKKYGASVPFMRSDANANDFATTMDVLAEVVSAYSNAGREFEEVCCLYATSPFVTNELLKKSYTVFKENNFDSLLPVVQYSFPIQRALSVKNGKLIFFQPENANKRSQDLSKSFHDSGQFYWLKNELVQNGDMIITSNTGSYELSELEAQDIDNEIDWKLAELKYELLQQIK